MSTVKSALANCFVSVQERCPAVQPCDGAGCLACGEVHPPDVRRNTTGYGDSGCGQRRRLATLQVPLAILTVNHIVAQDVWARNAGPPSPTRSHAAGSNRRASRPDPVVDQDRRPDARPDPERVGELRDGSRRAVVAHRLRLPAAQYRRREIIAAQPQPIAPQHTSSRIRLPNPSHDFQ
jgi:hypothetical protein